VFNIWSFPLCLISKIRQIHTYMYVDDYFFFYFIFCFLLIAIIQHTVWGIIRFVVKVAWRHNNYHCWLFPPARSWANFGANWFFQEFILALPNWQNFPSLFVKLGGVCFTSKSVLRKKCFWTWVRIQKPVVTYDQGKSSVTNCARLPNYIKYFIK
jgi:hypothetical protein